MQLLGQHLVQTCNEYTTDSEHQLCEIQSFRKEQYANSRSVYK
jgi:hypothetical protein